MFEEAFASFLLSFFIFGGGWGQATAYVEVAYYQFVFKILITWSQNKRRRKIERGSTKAILIGRLYSYELAIDDQYQLNPNISSKSWTQQASMEIFDLVEGSTNIVQGC